MYLAWSLGVLGSTASVLRAATAGALAVTDAVGLIRVGTDGVGLIANFVGDGFATSFGAGDGIATLETGGLLGETISFGVGSPKKLSLSETNGFEEAALGRFVTGFT